jgi:hypothetical protein
VLLGRLCLFGPGARRLHEEIIPVTAAWRDTRRKDSPLTPFAEAGEATTIQQLDSALRDGVTPGAGVLERLALTVERDIADLRLHIEARAKASEQGAIADLTENGRREAEAMAALLTGAFGVYLSHRDDGVDAPVPAFKLNAYRTDLDFGPVVFENDAVVIDRLGMDDFAKEQVHLPMIPPI